ncbi:glycosyltransferase [Mucilaginibacter sp. L3T2-6]|uniref:glycosyltransferase n=1 Tax=Mucilaginibacter sp. L3T2-6 TaxID=3062491 RepID=UPI002676436C|nr:glycosyltransferase [Mucilaginibacter sp. L3T2-6]MDO3644415.1 glycosyltransferase [Mucilaginibacter sp. L3T2-6]MDV6216867.1 glycosyltransferase [Mucilaginibacter sp. L3T2-6]
MKPVTEMVADNKNVLFVSMSDVANGAENVLAMAARAINAPIIFLQKIKKNRLTFSANQQPVYITDKSMIAGFLGLIKSIKPYRRGFIIISTHSYLNAYLGFLKRIGYLKSQLIFRECTSVFKRYRGLKRLSYKIAYKIGYRAAGLIICQTALMRQQFLDEITFVQPERVIVKDNPIDLEKTLAKAERPLNDPDTFSDFICSAGRLIPEKGFDVLIRAFNGIKDQYPDLNLLLFGDGPQKEKLAALIKTYNLQGRILLKGWIDNPLPYFKKARACVVSSLKEGFPNVLLEMAAVNPVIVSTLCAGGIEAIPSIETAEVNDVNALTAAIKKALHKNAAPGKKLVDQYLSSRAPDMFISSILSAL